MRNEESMDRKIGQLLTKISRQVYAKKFEMLKGSYNYDYFLSKMLKELISGNDEIVSELDAAYDLKNVGYSIAFMPEKKGQGEIIPGFNSNVSYDNVKKPDLWVFRDGIWIFVEIKHIKFGKTSLFWKEGEETSPAKERIVKQIKQRVKKCIAQTKDFQNGLAYVVCRQGIVDIESLNNTIDSLFKQNTSFMGLVLRHNKVFDKQSNEDGSYKSCKVSSQVKVIINPYCKLKIPQYLRK